MSLSVEAALKLDGSTTRLYARFMRYSVIQTMHPHGVRITLAVVLSLAFASLCPADSDPRLINGVLDFSARPFSSGGPLDVEGAWEFYWNEYITPGKSYETNTMNPIYLAAPHSWNGVAGFPVFGYATYRCILIVADEDVGSSLAFKTNDVCTAFSLYVNGMKKVAVGVAGRSKSETTPTYRPEFVTFVAQKRNEVVIHVANFHNNVGGLWGPLIIGPFEAVNSLNENRLAFELFLFGSLLMMGLYHFGLFALRRKELTYIAFGLFCTTTAIRLFVTGERYVIQLLPGLSWEVLFKIEYITFYLGVAFFLMFIRVVFSGELPTLLYRVFWVTAAAFTLVTIATDAAFFTKFQRVYQVLSVLGSASIVWAVVRSVIRRREGAILFLVSSLALIGTFVNDVLYSNEIVHTGFWAPFGFLVFVFAQSSFLSRRFARSFTTVERLYDEIRTLNAGLEEKIRDRTAQLEEANKELELMVVTDGLSGLFNHNHIYRRIEEEVIKAKRYGTRFSVVMFDLDHFKHVNDRYGHQTGDRVLIEFSNIMRHLKRETDIAGRYGGEEFTLILPMTGEDGAFTIAERIRDAIACLDLPLDGGDILKVTVSAGVAAWNGESALILMRRSDNALYRAKHGGRNRTERASEIGDESVSEPGTDHKIPE